MARRKVTEPRAFNCSACWREFWATPDEAVCLYCGFDMRKRAIYADPAHAPMPQERATPHECPYDAALDRLDAQEQLRQGLGGVKSSRGVAVLCYRYGILGHSPHTLQQCAEQFHVTRERVRQIEARALRQAQGHVERLKLLRAADRLRRETEAERRGRRWSDWEIG